MNLGIQKKKILIGLNNLAIGGAQQQLVRQLRYFDQSKYEIILVTLIAETERNSVLGSVPHYVRVEAFAFAHLVDLRSWAELLSFLKREKPDLVMSSFFFSNTVFRILKLICGYPIISREHNTYIDKNVIQIFIDKILSLASARIVAVSDEVADFTAKQEGIAREKFLVIHNGIDLIEIEKIRAQISPEVVRSSLQIMPYQKIALTVGRLIKQKDQALLIRGFAQFVHTNNDWLLLVVGGGGEYENLISLVRELEIGDRVRFLGEQDNVHQFYMISCCLVTTSYIEGMSNVHLEALAHGLPILTTPTGGSKSIIDLGDTGFLIEKRTPTAVAAVLDRYAASDIQAMKQKAFSKACEFDIRETVRSYEELFDTYAQ